MDTDYSDRKHRLQPVLRAWPRRSAGSTRIELCKRNARLSARQVPKECRHRDGLLSRGHNDFILGHPKVCEMVQFLLHEKAPGDRGLNLRYFLAEIPSRKASVAVSWRLSRHHTAGPTEKMNHDYSGTAAFETERAWISGQRDRCRLKDLSAFLTICANVSPAGRLTRASSSCSVACSVV